VLDRHGTTLHLNAARIDRELGRGTADASQSGTEHRRLVAWLNDREGSSGMVIYEADDEGVAHSRPVLRRG
jgi:hypothetical protein